MTELANALRWEALYRLEEAEIGVSDKARWCEEMTWAECLDWSEPRSSETIEGIMRWVAQTCGKQIIIRGNGELILSRLEAADYWKA